MDMVKRLEEIFAVASNNVQLAMNLLRQLIEDYKKEEKK
jgi:hypothetical protein